MTTVRFLPEASEEFGASAVYYESHERGLGQAFVSEVEKALARIARHPKAARLVVGEIRRRLVHRFPYSVLYCARDDEIIVIAVAHRRRRPGYWAGRS